MGDYGNKRLTVYVRIENKFMEKLHKYAKLGDFCVPYLLYCN